jgi:hypothetical protein
VTDHAISAPAPRTTWIAVALSMVAGALVSLAVMGLTGSGDAPTRHAGADAPFTLHAPAGWTHVATAPSGALAVLRSADGRATVVVRPAAAVTATGPQLARSLGEQLRRRFSGFRPVSARFATVRGGRAFVYTFVRAPRGTVQTLALTSIGGKSYAIDAVAPGDAAQLARQAGQAVASFGP